MLLPHIHREGSTQAPAGHRGEAGEQTPHPPPFSSCFIHKGKIEEQMKALMLKPLGFPTL